MISFSLEGEAKKTVQKIQKPVYLKLKMSTMGAWAHIYLASQQEFFTMINR
jgi:hypothetical protein